MIRKKLYKESKPIVTLATIAVMLITGVTPARTTVNSNIDFAPNAVQQPA